MSVHVDPGALPGRIPWSDLRSPCRLEPTAEVVVGGDIGGRRVVSSEEASGTVLPHSTS